MIHVEAEAGLVLGRREAGHGEGAGGRLVHAAEDIAGVVETVDPLSGDADGGSRAGGELREQAEAAFLGGVAVGVEGGREGAAALGEAVSVHAGERERCVGRGGEVAGELLGRAVIAHAHGGRVHVGLSSGDIIAGAGHVTAGGLGVPFTAQDEQGEDAFLVGEAGIDFGHERLAGDLGVAAEKEVLGLEGRARGHADDRVAVGLAGADFAVGSAAIGLAGRSAEVARGPELALLAHAVIRHQRAVVGAFEGQVAEVDGHRRQAAGAIERAHPLRRIEQGLVGVGEGVDGTAGDVAVADDDGAVGGDARRVGSRSAGEEAKAGHGAVLVDESLFGAAVGALADDDRAVGADRVRDRPGTAEITQRGDGAIAGATEGEAVGGGGASNGIRHADAGAAVGGDARHLREGARAEAGHAIAARVDHRKRYAYAIMDEAIARDRAEEEVVGDRADDERAIARDAGGFGVKKS